MVFGIMALVQYPTENGKRLHHYLFTKTGIQKGKTRKRKSLKCTLCKGQLLKG